MKSTEVRAVVTGGASGLGLATVRRIVSAGGRAAILDRPASDGERIAAELGEAAIFTPADVTSEEAVTEALDRAVEAFGSINVCVNCAGVGSAMKIAGKAGAMPLDVFKMTIDVNLVGTFNVSRLAAMRMRENEPNEEGERGVIVNTASVAAFDGQIGQVAYSASKAGVVGMTLVIARDLAREGIRCCTIAPGTFDTPMLGLLPDEQRQALAAGIPFPSRLGRPDEFGALACHIIENPYLNGETIRLDGALRMPPR
ncbi:MAG: 3-hydroxyacyl-CoA dehydrogenase [Deltaproteobacteria bacterium]|nr:MAG: 3-hydroxyacyl-CoA dehydrogenase [Deltaproteobacteria bacterium]